MNRDKTREGQVIFGRNAVYEALRSGKEVRKIYLAKGLDWRGMLRDAISLAREDKIPIVEAPRDALDRLVRRGSQHQGIVAEIAEFQYAELDELFEIARVRNEPAFFLALDRVQYLSNFGALLRTAEAVGIHGVIVPEHRQASVTAEVRKASAGAVDFLRIAQVTNLTNAIELLKKHRVWVAGIEDDPKAQIYTDVDLTGPLGLVVGNELHGLSRLVREHCDFLVKLPMWGQLPSLNVSVAGSIVLYEAKRQRTRGGESFSPVPAHDQSA